MLGTDTGVGKTFVASLLARGLRRIGHPVGVFKPFASGSYADARQLWEAAGRPGLMKEVVGFYYEKPLAPAVKFLGMDAWERDRVWKKTQADFGRRLSAWQVQRVTLSPTALSGSVTALARNAEGDRPAGERPRGRGEGEGTKHQFPVNANGNYRLIVEGLGGVLSPIVGRKTLADWLRPRIPVWLVARPNLGTLNQISLCLEALERRRLKVKRVILTPTVGRSLVEKTNVRWLRQQVQVPVGLLPRVSGDIQRDRWASIFCRWGEEDLG